MSDPNSNIIISKRALKNQLGDISKDSNLQRMAAIGGLVNDMNFTFTENVIKKS